MSTTYITKCGFEVQYKDIAATERTRDTIEEELDSHLGCFLSSTYEFPGRYTRFDLGFSKPPLRLQSLGRSFVVDALNERGLVLLSAVAKCLETIKEVVVFTREEETKKDTDGRIVFGSLKGEISNPKEAFFSEEERSRQPSIFTVLRAIITGFSPVSSTFGERRDSSGGNGGGSIDNLLGLYGAFSYDLAFQFNPIPLRMERTEESQRDVVLFIPDRILRIDHRYGQAVLREYDFIVEGKSTEKLERSSTPIAYQGQSSHDLASADHAPGEYAKLVQKAKEMFREGVMFEVVPGQMFTEPCPAPPSRLFKALKERNPSPYGFLYNLGRSEYLVGASPEMYVRVETNGRVETCPISGTIARGADAFGDEANIRSLLNDPKEESELSMCTDVDRNDKSRVCKAGTVRVIGRRLIEKYSRLIHTVDHVEGYLRDGMDAIDAFMTHMWAVTVTGAPKSRAMEFIEQNERSPRAWYAGAVGQLCFDGGINTGLTLRTIRIINGVAQVRAGATLLYDSNPDSEEAETRLKASAFIDALRVMAGTHPSSGPGSINESLGTGAGEGLRILLVDYEDSFVHTLANYLRQSGAEVITLRHGFDTAMALKKIAPDAVVLSPGPNNPSYFHIDVLIKELISANMPIFGVCLGMQAIVEYFGGKLKVLGYPFHGKRSAVRITSSGNEVLFKGLGKIPSEGSDDKRPELVVARYHSLVADPETFPHAELNVAGEIAVGVGDDAGQSVIMAVSHQSLPLHAVQFHPESILTESGAGQMIINNVMRSFQKCKKTRGQEEQ